MTQSNGEENQMPLQGVRVVDLTMAWAGPLAMRVLAELGADVIKIEAASKMDRWRGGTFVQRGTERYPDHDPGERPWNRNSYFNTQNIGKRSLVVDLKTDQGKEIFRSLVERSDLVAENFGAGAMARLGLDYPNLCEIKSNVVMLSMPAFGRTGPESSYIAHGPTIEEMAGNAFVQGYEDGPPLPSGRLAWGDPVAGINGALAALIALRHLKLTGDGQHIDLSHVEAAIPFNFPAVMDSTINARNPVRVGNSHHAMVPHGVYPASGEDAWVAIACRDDDDWHALTEVADLGRFGSEPDLKTISGRRRQREAIDGAVEHWTRGIDRMEIARILQEAGIPAGAVRSAADLSRDSHLSERGFFLEIDHPDAGRHRYPGMPWRFLRNPPLSAPAPAPMLGQHNREVLREVLGLDDEAITDLEAQGVIADDPMAQGD